MKYVFSPISVLMLATLAAPKSVAQDRLTLRVATWATSEEFALEAVMADRFMELYPHVRVEHETIPSGYRDKILASYAAGTVPDVLLLDSPIIPALLNRNLLVDLAPYEDSLGVAADAFYPSVRAVFARDSSLYAFPKDFTPLVIYFNKRLFDRAGLAYPAANWTWDDFLDLSMKLTIDLDGDGRADQFGTAFDNKLYLWQPWVWMNGGDILSEETHTATGIINSPKTVEALQYLIDLRNVHGVSPALMGVGGESGGNIQGTIGMFYAGRLAMMTSGRWALVRMRPYMRDGELEVGVAPLPTPVGGTHQTVIYAAGWSVSEFSEHRNWAIRLAAFLSSEEAQRIRAGSPIGVPSMPSVAAYQVAVDSFGVEQQFVDEAAFGRQSWGTRIDAFSRVEDIVERAVDESMIGGRDLEEALADAADQVDRMLAREAALSQDVTRLKGDPQIMGFLRWSIFLSVLLIFVSLAFVGRKSRSEMLSGFGFLTPAYVVLLVFLFVPLAFSLFLSIHQWNIISSTKPFVGLSNFSELLGDQYFWKAFGNTLIYTLHVPVSMACSLGIAMLLTQNIKGVAFWRALFFLPSISSLVAIAMVWQWIYHPEFGLANFTLGLLGLSPQPWLTSTSTALISVMIVNVWLSMGFQMVIFLAGLKSIPTTFYQAATVDGAGPWQQFRHVTLPLLRPTTLFVLVTSVISSFQVFTLVYIMTEGGPLGATDVVVYHIYQNAYDYLKMGYASAMAWVLFVIVVLITWIQFRVGGKRTVYA